MLRLYRAQSRRLTNARNYKAIVTHSSHMCAEFIQHGCDPAHIYNISYYSDHSNVERQQANGNQERTPLLATAVEATTERSSQAPWRLLFLGRMSFLKGGETLLAASAQARELLKRPLHVTFAGDGPERRRWEKQAARLEAQHEGLTIEFTGWIKDAQIDATFAQADLLVFPSLLPEPFGLIGLEAGHRGVPIAAFAVGGITDWLFEGMNGYLAPGDPPTARGLAEAIVKCLQDPVAHERLRRGAVEVANGFSMSNHLTTLLRVFERVLATSH